MEIEQEKLSRFEREILKSGSHENVEDGMCVMEMTAYLAGEKHSDHPACASPVISSFLRSLNDRFDDDARQLLKPYAIRVIGSAAAKDVETRRAWLAVDWLVRVYVPAWLKCARLTEEADAIRALPEITSTTIASALPTLCAAEQKASAAWRAASSAESEVWSAAWGPVEREARSAAWIAAESAVMSAVEHAIEGAVWRAIWSATWNAAKAAAFNAARNATRNAVLSVAESAAKSALKPTVETLQQSAVELLDRMIMVKKGTS